MSEQEPRQNRAYFASPMLVSLDLDNASKIIAGVVALVYFFGLIGVNRYLWGLGITNFSLLRTQYLFAGGLLCLPMVVAFGCWQASVYSLDLEEPGLPIAMKALRFVVIFCIPIAVNVALASGHDGLDWLQRLWDGVKLWYSSILVVTFGFGALASAILRMFPLPTTEHVPPQLARIAWAAMFGVCFAFAFLWYLSKFSSEIYPYVAQQFGGGKSVTARLLVSKEGAGLIDDVGIARAKGRITEEVEVVFETEKLFVIRLESGNILQLTKRVVDGTVGGEFMDSVKYEPNKQMQPTQ